MKGAIADHQREDLLRGGSSQGPHQEAVFKVSEALQRFFRRGDFRKLEGTWMSPEVSKWVITYLYLGYISVINHLLTIY